jgi:IS1 family transposase
LKKKDQRWLWHAIDHATGAVLAYVFGRRKDEVFLQLQALLEPFGLTRFYRMIRLKARVHYSTVSQGLRAIQSVSFEIAPGA